MTGRAHTQSTLRRAREMFLCALSEGASVSKSCELATIGRRTAYSWRDADDEFRALWDEALEAGIDKLEDEARRRAVEGVEKPVVAMGKVARNDDGTIMMVREYSDSLLAMMLKAKKPNEYKDRMAQDVNLTGGVNININGSGGDADL